MSYHLTAVRKNIMKKSTSKMLERVWRNKNSYTVYGNVNQCSPYEEQYGGFLQKKKKTKLKLELTYDPTIPLLVKNLKKIII